MRAESLLQPNSDRECYLTGSQSGLDCHHIYAGIANRKLSDKYGCWVWLKHSIHMDLHNKCKDVDKMLKRECQKAFEAKYSHKEFMEIFGKNYLREDD